MPIDIIEKNVIKKLVDAEQYITENQFAAGSMLPKVQAALKFIENKSKKEAIIANLENAQAAIESETGTKFIN